MEDFIGREKELSRLEHLYLSGKFETCAIYGRRQIGKTALMSKFSSGKRTINFRFSKNTKYENLSYMGIVIGAFLGTNAVRFDSLSEAINAVEKICYEEKTIVIFDEYPFLVRSIPDAPSIIQRFIDSGRDSAETLVLICGSSISMMRREIEDYDSPLYGRFSNRLNLGPLSLAECTKFHPKMSDEDVLRTYLTVGGVPKYHRIMDADTYMGCIRKCFLGTDAPLKDESCTIVERELSPSDVHSSILSCIADGKNLQNEIVDALGISKAVCSRYIANLGNVGMVEPSHPMLTARKKPYFISDNLLAFHYTVLEKYAPFLENSDTARTYRLMRHDIDTFLGRRFEILCRRYVAMSYFVKEIGTWWGRIGDKDADIDIVADIYNKDDLVITVLGECKFRKDPVDMSVIYNLKTRGMAARADSNIRYAVFSLGGFTEELAEYAADSGILLIGREKLLGKEPPDEL